MKRLILIVSAALVFAAEAKLEKVVDVTLADQQGLVNVATKIGGFVGEPMLGMMPAGLFMANPLSTQGFGPARGDGNFYAAVYMDGSEISGDIEQLVVNDKVKFAVLYPVSSSKADFLAANPQSKEADGVIPWNGMSVVFSADGKYAAIANDGAAARTALSDAAGIPALKKDEAARVRVFNAGMQLITKILESEKEIAKMSPRYIEIYKSITKIELSLCAGDYGIDIRSSFDCVPGSLLSKLGNRALSSDAPLAFAGKDALFAVAYAADAAGSDVDVQWKKFKAFAEKWGIRTGWLSYEKKGVNAKFVLDPAALSAYAKSEGRKKFEELAKREDEVAADAMTVFKPAVELNSPEQACAFYIKGAKAAADAQSLFNKVLPGFAKKPCAGVGVFSAYGFIKAVGDVVCPLACDKDAAEAKAVIAKLPAAGGSAIAYAWTKKGPTVHEYTVRANPAEIRNLATFFKTVQAEQQKKLNSASEDAD